MNHFGHRNRVFILLALLLVGLILPACKKKSAGPRLPPSSSSTPGRAGETPRPAPTVTLTATPATVRPGQATTISWEARDADTVMIDGGIGNVGQSGSRVLTLKSTTTFTATASGPGGTASASARVTVSGQAEDTGAINVTGTPGTLAVEALFDQNVRDVFFEYDKFELSPEAIDILYVNANFLRQYQAVRVMIEGHCDERGTVEYNLALGDRRAKVTKDFLISLGIGANRISTISYGEERPFDAGHDEDAWVKNRRAHFKMVRP